MGFPHQLFDGENYGNNPKQNLPCGQGRDNAKRSRFANRAVPIGSIPSPTRRDGLSSVARDGVEKRLRFSTKTILTVDPVPVISRVPRLIILKWDIWNSIQENLMWPGTGFTNALHS